MKIVKYRQKKPYINDSLCQVFTEMYKISYRVDHMLHPHNIFNFLPELFQLVNVNSGKTLSELMNNNILEIIKEYYFFEYFFDHKGKGSNTYQKLLDATFVHPCDILFNFPEQKKVNVFKVWIEDNRITEIVWLIEYLIEIFGQNTAEITKYLTYDHYHPLPDLLRLKQIYAIKKMSEIQIGLTLIPNKELMSASYGYFPFYQYLVLQKKDQIINYLLKLASSEMDVVTLSYALLTTAFL